MNPLHRALKDYLALRRGLGYKMRDAGRLLQLRELPGGAAGGAHHGAIRTAMGAASRGSASRMGSALGVRTGLRTLPQCYRSTDRGSGCTALATPLYPGEALRARLNVPRDVHSSWQSAARSRVGTRTGNGSRRR